MDNFYVRKFGMAAPVILIFCGCAHSQHPKGYSMAQATGTPQSMVRTSGPQLPTAQNSPRDGAPAGAKSSPSSTSIAQQIRGGSLIKYEPGLIVVVPSSTPDSLQPTGLTTDAIITSSVMSKIAGQAKLKAKNYEVKADNGIVSIHAKEESIEDAVTLINLALSVADIRRIVYTMPTAV
jgi:hypothetical protein